MSGRSWKKTMAAAVGKCKWPVSGALVLAVASVAVSAVAQDLRLSAGELQFVQHPTHCAHLIGGRQFVESPAASYGAALEVALAGATSQADIKAVYARLRQACPAMLAQRPAQQKTAEAID